MISRILYCLIAMLLLSVTLPSFADVYKWKDIDGRTHYGDTSPSIYILKEKASKKSDDLFTNDDKSVAGKEKPSKPVAASEAIDLANSPVIEVHNRQ